MTAYNFKARFANDVESGDKTQTIRARRKDGYKPRPGEKLQLYTGMRTKDCRKLRDAVCTHVFAVEMIQFGIKLDGRPLYPGEAHDLAVADGFKGIGEFLLFFKENHGFPFEGFLIKWE